MKINIVFPEFGLSGGVMVGLRYARALTDLGHDVLCYAQRAPYRFPQSVKGALHNVHRMISNYDVNRALERCGSFKYKVPLFITDKTVRNADVTIATAWCTAFDVDRLSASKGRKYYFIQGHEIWDDKDKGIQSYKLPLKHIAIAKWIDDILVKDYGCEPATIVHNGVDLNVFKPKKSKREENMTISMMYHLLAKKGIPDGLQALEEIHKKYPDIKMIMFGKPDFSDKPDYIEYHRDPSLELLVSIYQQSDIFLFPAREEGWGLTVIEAMACGCAVVGTNAGALLEVGKDNVNALISEPGKPEQLIMNLERLIQDKELLNTIQDNAINTAQEFDWNKSYQKFEKALKM